VSAGRGWVEESLWVLGHLINVEEHAVELGLLDVAAEVREERRAFQDEWWRALGVTEAFYRRAWCVFKHLAALVVHAEELAAWGEAPPELREASREAEETARKLFWTLVELGRRISEETVEVKA
jgi:hypothetical protein